MGGRRQNSRPAVREAASGEAALDVRPNVTTVEKNNITTCSGRKWKRNADWGFPGIIDRNNFWRYPCPVKLTSLPYKALKLEDGTYGVPEPDDPAGVWYRNLLNKEWDRTAVSFALARRKYFEWFRNREAREARRKNHRLEKVAHEVLTRAEHRHALLCVSPNQMACSTRVQGTDADPTGHPPESAPRRLNGGRQRSECHTAHETFVL